MILVVLAIGRRASLLFSTSTLPVTGSYKIPAFAFVPTISAEADTAGSTHSSMPAQSIRHRSLCLIPILPLRKNLCQNGMQKTKELEKAFFLFVYDKREQSLNSFAPFSFVSKKLSGLFS